MSLLLLFYGAKVVPRVFNTAVGGGPGTTYTMSEFLAKQKRTINNVAVAALETGTKGHSLAAKRSATIKRQREEEIIALMTF